MTTLNDKDTASATNSLHMWHMGTFRSLCEEVRMPHARGYNKPREHVLDKDLKSVFIDRRYFR